MQFILDKIILLALIGCAVKSDEKIKITENNFSLTDSIVSNPQGTRTIHVFVALCDNKYQGIVPVPAKIGNGQDATNNLYWGAVYGVKNYFKTRSKEWQFLRSVTTTDTHIIERLLFKHRYEDVYLLADAYDGIYIKNTTVNFLNSSAGNNVVPLVHGNDTLYFGGASNLLAYVGHDGLMDFTVSEKFVKRNNDKREAIILACYSKKYFSPHLNLTGAEPLVWSTGLMAPEAYILHDAVNAWIEKEEAKLIRQAAARAYSKFQKCSQRAAENLLVTGW